MGNGAEVRVGLRDGRNIPGRRNGMSQTGQQGQRASEELQEFQDALGMGMVGAVRRGWD